MINKDQAIICLIIIMMIYVYNLHKNQLIKDDEYNKKLKMFITLNDEYRNRLHNATKNHKEVEDNKGITVAERDIAVVKDPLYPPINRHSQPLANEYIKYRNAGIFDVPSRTNNDTYRLMGYLINSVNKEDKWNIYGRQRHPGSSHGNFYATQQCNNNSCTKIELSKDILVNEQLNDFYNLPSTLMFKSPLFAVTSYDVVQLSMPDNYTNPYY